MQMQLNRSIDRQSGRGPGSVRLLAAAVLVAATVAGGASAETVTKVADLRGGQEVPANASPARGCARMVIDTVANTIAFHISYSGLIGAETAAHFHGNAAPGVNAGVKIGLPAGNPKVGTVVYAQADEAALLAGSWYINIHTTMFGGGEIRGQVADFVSDVNAFQENPSTGTAGSGWGVFNIDTCANTLSYHIVVEALSAAETAAHIHGFALHDVNAGVKHPLPAGPLKVGAWTYAESDEPGILAGQTYVNIHSAAFGGGEIRGQIVNIVAPIDGAQEVPASGSASTGSGLLAVDTTGNRLSYYIRHSGLASGETAAHIHGFAGPGVNAGVKHALPAGVMKKGAWSYAAADEPSILAGLTYINIHSAAFGGGEIRGQILFPTGPCVGDLDCDGSVNIVDLLALLAQWGPCPAAPAPCGGDTNYDGVVNIVDLLDLLAGWGGCP